jgi:hypothetical protein
VSKSLHRAEEVPGSKVLFLFFIVVVIFISLFFSIVGIGNLFVFRDGVDVDILSIRDELECTIEVANLSKTAL